ncbi:MAG: hypothetical protein ABIJ34_02500 [archaeon]
MSLTKLNLNINQKGLSREELRKIVVGEFLKEKHGPADDETYQRYEYLVEKTLEGNILLIRPANLKLGFDFRIDVDKMTFRKGTHAPTHIDLFEDLKFKYSKNEEFCNKVIEAIVNVNKMIEPKEILITFEDKKIGFSVDLLLKLSKWFAVEQDIRYWNGWGRMKQVLWLQLMQYFEFRYKAVDTGFNFFDKDGTLLSEEKSIKILKSNG